jgi:hypothetical protein
MYKQGYEHYTGKAKTQSDNIYYGEKPVLVKQDE